MILEVGLGGRLDAVNAVDCDACLITNVTLDHCDWLGDDIESIATEKAGVMRSQTPVVFGSTTVPEAIIAESDRSGANLILLARDYGFATTADDLWSWSGANIELDGLQRPSLKGEHQVQNAAGVLALLESLGLGALLDAGAVNRALTSLDLPGRMQRFEQAGRNFIVDVAHNVDSARVLCEAVRSIEGFDRVFVVIGVLAGKDVAGIVSALQAAANRWIACTPDSAKPVSAEELAREIAQRSGKSCLISESVELAVREAMARAAGSDLIVITGSFQTVAPALRCLDDLQCAS